MPPCHRATVTVLDQGKKVEAWLSWARAGQANLEAGQTTLLLLYNHAKLS